MKPSLQILAIISGLFAACQPFRQVLLVMLILSCLFSFTYNVFLTLWYSNILVVDDHRKTELLSAGLPFSYSFFLRHTPFCESRFDLALSQWKQDEGCLIPYVYFEEFQACLHAAIALIVVFLSISTFCNYRDEKKRLKRQTSLFETASSVPRGLGLGRQKLFTPPNSLSLEIKAQSLANTMSAAMPKMPTSVYIRFFILQVKH